MIRSPINYHGGKHYALETIIPALPDNIDTFYDIMAGGFNVGINVEANKVIYNDICNPLMGMFFEMYRSFGDSFLNDVKWWVKEFNLNRADSSGYLALREHYNSREKGIGTGTVLYALISSSFSNLVRFNSKGEFNATFGKRCFNPSMEKNLILFINKLISKEILFFSEPYLELLGKCNPKPNDFIYFDPPYRGSGAEYNSQWSESHDIGLLKTIEFLHYSLGIKFGLSNDLQGNPKLKDWADQNGFKIIYLPHYDNRNCFASKKDKKTPNIEVYITNHIGGSK